MSLGEFWAQSGIVALWHLSNLSDSSGNGRTLTNNGTVTFESAKFGNGASFGSNNSSKYLSIAAFSGVAFISGWFYIQKNNALQTLLQYATTDQRYIIQIADAGGGNWIFRAYCNGNSLSSTITPSINTWYWIALNIGTTCELYVNGVLAASGSKGSETYDYNIAIGAALAPGASQYFSGKADEVMFASSNMSASWIRRWYALSRGLLY